jgi:ribonuclease PH
LSADGGTRCASITAAYVALALAFRKLCDSNVIKSIPLIGQVAAVSCGIYEGQPVLDLDYDEDSAADADANFILTQGGGIVEIQATAETSTFDDAGFQALLGVARVGTAELLWRRRGCWGKEARVPPLAPAEASGPAGPERSLGPQNSHCAPRRCSGNVWETIESPQ